MLDQVMSCYVIYARLGQAISGWVMLSEVRPGWVMFGQVKPV